MAAGRGRARTVEADRGGEGDQTRAPTTEQSPGGPEPTAQGWEFDEADTWEPVVPERWEVPPDRAAPPDVQEERAEAPSAGWSDAARSEDEWADAARHGANSENSVEEAVRVPHVESVSTQYLGEEPVPVSRADARDAARQGAAGEPGSNRARMVLGLATLAAQRLRGGIPVGDGFVTGVGLAQETANGLRELGRRVITPASRIAAGAMNWAATLPVAGLPVRAAQRSRTQLSAVAEGLRERGHETVENGRADAEWLLRNGFDRARRWANDNALGPLVERLAPIVAERLRPNLVAEVTGEVTGSGPPNKRPRR